MTVAGISVHAGTRPTLAGFPTLDLLTYVYRQPKTASLLKSKASVPAFCRRHRDISEKPLALAFSCAPLETE